MNLLWLSQCALLDDNDIVRVLWLRDETKNHVGILLREDKDMISTNNPTRIRPISVAKYC